MSVIKNIFKNQLFKVSSLNGLSVVTRIIGGLLAGKVAAAFLGPSGLAMLGNFRNFLSSLDAFSTLGMQNGIVKYTAQYENDRNKQYESLATAFITIAVFTLVIGAAMVMPAVYWSRGIFNGDGSFYKIFWLTGLALPLYAGSIVLIAVLNGLSRYKNVIWITIWTNALGVVISSLLIYYLGLWGAFVALLSTPSLICLFATYGVYRATGFAFFKMKYFKPAILKGLLSYSLMSVVTAVLGPVIYIVLRNMIIDHQSGHMAGYWEGINRISVFYMMFITTLLSVYFLPKLSQSESVTQTKGIIRGYYGLVMPVFAAGLLLVYVLRKFITVFTLSEAFMPMEKLFIWQLLGDFFKGCTLILTQEFFARKMTRAYIGTEVASYGILYFSGSFLIKLYGVEGAVMAHAFTGIIMLLLFLVLFRRKIF